MPYDVIHRSHAHQRQPLIQWGGVGLAALAGYVNVAMLQIFNVPVSHMSGAVSRLGIDLGGGALDDLRLIIVIPVCFLVGATLCGMIIGSQRFRPSRLYGQVLLIESGFLAVAGVFNLLGSRHGVAFAALACGLQNALASSYCGLVIRTTHVTGIVTDFGVMLGQWLRYRTPGKGWKLGLLSALFAGFFTGGLLAALVHPVVGEVLLMPAAGTCALMGIWYNRRQYRRRRHFIKARLRFAAKMARRSSGRLPIPSDVVEGGGSI